MLHKKYESMEIFYIDVDLITMLVRVSPYQGSDTNVSGRPRKDSCHPKSKYRLYRFTKKFLNILDT